MGEINLSTALMLAAAAASGAGLAALLMHLLHGQQLKRLYAKLEKADKSRAHTNEMLMQARRQAEGLQKELLMARRPVAMPEAAKPAPKAEAAKPVAAAPAPADKPARPAADGPHPLSQAALTQAQALSRARERSRQVSMPSFANSRQEEHDMQRTAVLPPGQSFADTLPLPGL
jgi:DNA polymerase III gamma/tau subunit